MAFSESELAGLRLAAVFSTVPNCKDYCGPAESWKAFEEFLKTGKGPEKVAGLLEKFVAFYPYAELIGEASGKKPFDLEVVEAYWLGNELLEKIGPEDVAKMIKAKFEAPHLLPKTFAEKLVAGIPGNPWPHHSFQVLYVHFITGKVAKTVENEAQCLVSWARVERADGDGLVVKGPLVTLENGKYVLSGLVERKVATKLPDGFQLAADAAEGDWVGVHWGLAVRKLSDGELCRLQRYTKHTLEILH